MKLTPIKDEDNLFRDTSSNAILFKNDNSNGTERRNEVFRNAIQDINNLKEEVSEIKQSLNKIVELLTKGNS